MLVLSRQRDETIMIGDDIEITVVDIRGDKVRLGINAPTSIAVHRKEVYEAIKRENEQAARLLDNKIDLLHNHGQLVTRTQHGDAQDHVHETKQAARTLLNHHLNPLKSRSA